MMHGRLSYHCHPIIPSKNALYGDMYRSVESWGRSNLSGALYVFL